MPLGPLPSLGPFGRVVDVRVYPHGLVGGGNNLGQGAGLARPNLSSDAWYAAGLKYGGNVLWPGSSPRYTLAYAGPRYRLFGLVSGGGFTPWRNYAVLNGAPLFSPGPKVLGAGIRTYDDLPTTVGTYTGTGDGTLALATPATGPGAVTGTWRVRCIQGGAGARFELLDPDDVSRGTVGMDVLFDGPVRFTVTAGAIAFASGDEWPIDVEQREQIILICQSVSGSTAVPDVIYRRARDSATAWRVVGAVAAIAGAVYPTPAPWVINASGTHAATVRIIGGVFTRCILDLDTLTVAQTAISAPTIQVVKSGDTWSTPNTGPHETIIGAEYAGDKLREWIVVAQGNKAGAVSGGNAVSGTISVTADLHIRDGGSTVAVAPIWSYLSTVNASFAAGEWTSSGTHMEFTRHVYAWGHGDVPVAQWPQTVWSGTVDVADGTSPHTGGGIFSIFCQTLTSPGNTVVTDYTLTRPNGTTTPAAFTQTFFANYWATDEPDCRSPATIDSPWRPFAWNKQADFDIGRPDEIQELFGLYGLNWSRLGGAGGVSGSAVAIAWVSGGWSIFGNDIHVGGQAGERFPDWYAHSNSLLWTSGLPIESLRFDDRVSVGAADNRGNYLVAIEDVDYAVGALANLGYDQATGTGNMLIFTGGPGGLTTTQVHTLVGSADNMLVAVGAF